MKDKQPTKIPEKQWFDIKVEATVPATITYRVFATDEEEAYKLSLKQQPRSIVPRLVGKKITKATIYLGGTLMIKAIKNFVR